MVCVDRAKLAATTVTDATTASAAPTAYEVVARPAPKFARRFAVEMALRASTIETTVANPPKTVEMRAGKLERRFTDPNETAITPAARATRMRLTVPGRTIVDARDDWSSVAQGSSTDAPTAAHATVSTARRA